MLPVVCISYADRTEELPVELVKLRGRHPKLAMLSASDDVLLEAVNVRTRHVELGHEARESGPLIHYVPFPGDLPGIVEFENGVESGLLQESGREGFEI
jgi:hypothetical protein